MSAYEKAVSLVAHRQILDKPLAFFFGWIFFGFAWSPGEDKVLGDRSDKSISLSKHSALFICWPKHAGYYLFTVHPSNPFEKSWENQRLLKIAPSRMNPGGLKIVLRTTGESMQCFCFIKLQIKATACKTEYNANLLIGPQDAGWYNWIQKRRFRAVGWRWRRWRR